jgi:hypothetical protein
MSRKNKGRMAPFVPLYRLTMKHPAWRALSHGARSTYMLLMSNYNTNMEHYVYLSVRKGAKELGSNMKSVARWLHELEFYGCRQRPRAAQGRAFY